MAQDPQLPRPPEDPEHLRRLREQAWNRVRNEEIEYRTGPTFNRRWTIRGLLILAAGAAAATAAWVFGNRPSPFVTPVAVYGGPPPRVPEPEPQPVPPTPEPAPPTPDPAPAGPEPPPVDRTPPPKPPRPAAAVYGGPVPRRPQP